MQVQRLFLQEAKFTEWSGSHSVEGKYFSLLEKKSALPPIKIYDYSKVIKSRKSNTFLIQ